MDSASIYYVSHGTRRVIVSYLSQRSFCSYPENSQSNPFETLERVIAPDIDAKPRLRKALRRITSSIETDNWNSLVRLVIPAGQGERFAVLVTGTKTRKPLSRPEIRYLDQIQEGIGRVCLGLLPLLRRFRGRPGFPLTLEEVAHIVRGAGSAMGMRDDKLRMLAASPDVEGLCGQKITNLLGRDLKFTIGSFADSMAVLARHAIETGFTTPSFEVAIPVPGTRRVAHVELSLSPAYLIGRKLPVFVAHYQKPRRLDGKNIRNPPSGFDDGAIVDFLFDTLPRHRCIRNRGDISYITIRSWSLPIKTHQIKAFAAIKRHAFDAAAARIAKEIHGEVERFAGFDGFSAIIPVPGGHSDPRSTFSVAVARALSQLAGLPLINAFDHQQLTGTSHPKANAQRPAMNLNTRINRPVILIDDVATSGRHIEECVNLLRGDCKTVLAIAWIGGNLTAAKAQ